MRSAKVIADSVSPEGKRLVSIELRYEKFIHGELMTHRVFSRNASSSRAVPTKKLLEEARSRELRAEPSFSVVNAPGMQGGRPTTDQERETLRRQWDLAAHYAAAAAEVMFEAGGAKQDVNRLLEPFTHINVLVTSTQWDNFFGLRLDKDAQPEMRRLAEAMWVAFCESEPAWKKPGEWHLPYVTDDDWQLAHGWLDGLTLKGEPVPFESVEHMLLRVSTARCARVSYRSHETGKASTVDEDLTLYMRLLARGAKHASPAEHQATPDDVKLVPSAPPLRSMDRVWANPDEHGNFVGWRQHRKMIPGEAVAPLPKGYQWPITKGART